LGTFDLVIFASTIQFFPDFVYLEQVIEKALLLLPDGGAIVIADVPDAKGKKEFLKSLEEFNSMHSGDPAKKTRIRPNAHLYVDEDWFHDLRLEFGEVVRVEIAHRHTGFENELRYRYDVVIKKSHNESR